MSLLSHLFHTLKLAASQPPSPEDEIKSLLAFSPIPVPGDYLNLVRQGSELEIGVDLSDGGNWFIRIYGAAGVIEMNTIYGVQRNLKRSLALGDNEGGDMLVLVEDASPPGIYRIPMSCLSDMDEAIYIASSLTELLSHGKSLDLVF